MRTSGFVFLFLVIFGLTSCREGNLASVPLESTLALRGAKELPAQPSVDELLTRNEKRFSVVSLRVLNHPAPEFQKRVSRFDVGVAEVGEEHARCVLLEPRLKSYQEMPWAPLDFYFNAPHRELDPEEQRGEADVFYVGDEGNRLGAEAYSFDTILMNPRRPEIKFLETYREPSTATFFLEFEKGKMRYQGLLRVQATRKADTCVADAWICTKIEKTPQGHVCAPDGWTMQIDEIRVHVDIAQLLSGKAVHKLDVRMLNAEQPDYQTLVDLNDSSHSQQAQAQN